MVAVGGGNDPAQTVPSATGGNHVELCAGLLCWRSARGFPFELQYTGGCGHRIIGTSGSFDGVSGLRTFFDVFLIPQPPYAGHRPL